jgi:pimeloyl-ACP methyl ester carboxylesterase
MSTSHPNVRTVEYLGSPLALEWWEAGSGDPPMLLLHDDYGFSSAAPYATRLAASRRVIAAQHPGWGDSERPGWIDTVSDLAHFYLELLEQEDLTDVTVVGFSLGGWIAAEMAAWRPARIGRLVLVDAVGIRIGDRTDRDIADIFAVARDQRATLEFVDPAVAGPKPEEMSDTDLIRLLQAEEATTVYGWQPYMCNPKLRRRLASVTVPTAVLWGAGDQVVTPAYGQAYADALPHAELSIIEDAGHLPHIEQPQRFCELVESFVSRTTAS